VNSLKIETKNGMVAEKVKIANTAIDRMIGLMFSSDLSGFDGLLISPTNSIHTFFMRYELDIIFLNKENKVVKIIRNMKPWRMTRMYFKAVKVLEMKGGTLPVYVNVGDEFLIDV
jgi:uncharacterized protein